MEPFLRVLGNLRKHAGSRPGHDKNAILISKNLSTGTQNAIFRYKSKNILTIVNYNYVIVGFHLIWYYKAVLPM